MTDKVAKAEAAHRLVNDPLLVEAFDDFENALISRILEAPARDDDGRMRAAFAVQALRGVRKNLEKVIQDGKLAAKNAADEVSQEVSRFT